MYRSWRFSVAILLLMAAGTGWPAPTSPAVRLMCTDFPPFKIENGSPPGIDVEIIDLALKQEGISAQFDYAPWKRTVYEVKEGRGTALCGCAYRPEREKDFLYSDILGMHSQGIFIDLNKHKLNIESLADLEGLTVGTVRGYALQQELVEQGIQVAEANDNAHLISLLKKDRIDAIYGYRDIILYLLKDEPLPWHYHEFNSQPYYLCISRKILAADEFRQRFNRGLRQLHFDGRYQEVWKHYRHDQEQ